MVSARRLDDWRRLHSDPGRPEYAQEEGVPPSRVRVCAEINQCVGCTFSAMTWPRWLSLVPSSGEEPTSPRHRTCVASMAWRSTRLFRTKRLNSDFHAGTCASTTIMTGTAASTSAWARTTAATRSRAARSRARRAAPPGKTRTARAAGRCSPGRWRRSSRPSRSKTLRASTNTRPLSTRGRGHTPSAAPSYLYFGADSLVKIPLVIRREF